MPIQDFAWLPSTKARYNDQLEVLFPADWVGRAFLMGEAVNHDAEGWPRYHAHCLRDGAYQVGSRPITVDEFRLLTADSGCLRCRMDLIRFTREVRLPRFTMRVGDEWHLPQSYRRPDGSAELGAGIVPADAYETIQPDHHRACGCSCGNT